MSPSTPYRIGFAVADFMLVLPSSVAVAAHQRLPPPPLDAPRRLEELARDPSYPLDDEKALRPPLPLCLLPDKSRPPMLSGPPPEGRVPALGPPPALPRLPTPFVPAPPLDRFPP